MYHSPPGAKFQRLILHIRLETNYIICVNGKTTLLSTNDNVITLFMRVAILKAGMSYTHKPVIFSQENPGKADIQYLKTIKF
jgi:hypothetical protein